MMRLNEAVTLFTTMYAFLVFCLTQVSGRLYMVIKRGCAVAADLAHFTVAIRSRAGLFLLFFRTFCFCTSVFGQLVLQNAFWIIEGHAFWQKAVDAE